MGLPAPRVLKFDGPLGPKGCGIAAFGGDEYIGRFAASPAFRNTTLCCLPSDSLMSSCQPVYNSILSLTILTEILRFAQDDSKRREDTGGQRTADSG